MPTNLVTKQQCDMLLNSATRIGTDLTKLVTVQ